MLAYHNDPKIKRKYLARVRAHQRADEVVQGYGYWMDGQGCAVGCTIHGDNHKSYEDEIGYPAELAHLEDFLFERLPKEVARKWPARFLNAAKPGADLSRVYDLWSAWNLIDPVDGVINFVTADFPDVLKIVRETGEACLAGDRISSARAAEAAWAAGSAGAAEAAWAAGSAGAAEAAEAAWAAGSAEAAEAAWAAGSAGAAEAAEAAEAAGAAGAAWAAGSAGSAGAAGAAEAAYYLRAADKLIELIEAA